jgi:hypothetical protein
MLPGMAKAIPAEAFNKRWYNRASGRNRGEQDPVSVNIHQQVHRFGSDRRTHRSARPSVLAGALPGREETPWSAEQSAFLESLIGTEDGARVLACWW